MQVEYFAHLGSRWDDRANRVFAQCRHEDPADACAHGFRRANVDGVLGRSGRDVEGEGAKASSSSIAEMLKKGLGGDIPDPPRWLTDKVAKGDDVKGDDMKPKPGANGAAAMRLVARGAAKLMSADDGPRIAAHHEREP